MFYCKVNTFIHKFTISTIKILFCDIFSLILIHLLPLWELKCIIMTIDSITITFSVENTARADVMLTNSRVYYRFATIDTCEEGEMPCENGNEIISKITQSLNTTDNELMPQDVKCLVIITNNDNSKIEYKNDTITLDTYNSLINILSRIGDEFMFIRGFK